MKKKLKIGVTGGIASGKSTVCKIFEVRNYPVIYSDDVAKKLLANDEKVIDRIKSEFGERVYENGEPDKKYLAEKVFSDPEKLKIINSIIHPPAMAEIEKMMNASLKENNIVFVESALIFEAGLEDYFDNVLLVSAPDKDKINRVAEKGKLTAQQAAKRLANQIPDSEKQDLADFVIHNDKTLIELKINAEFFLKIFEGMIS